MFNNSYVLPDANGVHLSIGQEAEELKTCLLFFLYGIRFPGLHQGVPGLEQRLALRPVFETDVGCVCSTLSARLLHLRRLDSNQRIVLLLYPIELH